MIDAYYRFKNQRISMHLPSALRTEYKYFPFIKKPVFVSSSRLRKGENAKLSGIAGYLDLLSGVSCRKCCSGCYALKAERLYPDVYNHRLANYLLAKYHQGYFLSTLARDLDSLSDGSIVRLHSAGDFFSLKYTKGLFSLVKTRQRIKFYAYSKRPYPFQLDQPSNLSLIDSRKPFNGRNYTKDPAALERAQREGYFLCPATAGDQVKCNAGCSACFDSSRPKVIFKEH